MRADPFLLRTYPQVETLDDSPAARLSHLMLLALPFVDEEGVEHEPVITSDQLRNLLDLVIEDP